MNFIRALGNCLSSCRPTVITTIPGQQGPAGLTATPGIDGVNAYAVVNDLSSPQVPLVGAPVTLEASPVDWMAVAQVVFLQGYGYYSVTSINTVAGTATLTNLGYSGNAAPTTVIVVGTKISPAGIKGIDGSSSAVSGSVALTPATNPVAIPAPGGNFGFIPVAVLVSIRIPSGGEVLFGATDTIAATGFNVNLNSPAPGAGYFCDFVAFS